MEEFDTTDHINSEGNAVCGERQTSSRQPLGAFKVALLILLGFLWSVRLVAIKEAGLSGIPVHVTVTLSLLGIAAFFSLLALWRKSWPPIDKNSIAFYFLNGVMGFILPFILENLVAPRLPVFIFVVIISTMPIMTLALVTATRTERLTWVRLVTIGLGFCVALLVANDKASTASLQTVNWFWVPLAFGIPALYALNTVFIASRWPQTADAMHVAQAQALIISAAAIAGETVFGSIVDLRLASQNLPAICAIALTEGIALLVYLKITRDFGASFVSFANYISMVFAAILGALLFGDQLTWLSLVSAGILVLSLAINRFQSHSA